eukprot:TRINITY_DN10746_c0_g1_i1.p1 TRINITY_DN10746_c0_g1~~TRINITY_DN10746_c0_g1_i1.p1  ORF type:complete len:426 (-),score=103.57 TRINITY_DN10746_c0_g1_i1:39-1316(-)
MSDLENLYESIDQTNDADPQNLIAAFFQVIHFDVETNDENNKIKEKAIYGLGEIYQKLNQPEQIQELIVELRPLFTEMPNPKTAKIIRRLVDSLSKIDGSEQVAIEVCQDNIEWAKLGERNFLRLSLQTTLAQSFFQSKQYTQALDVIKGLLTEVKKLDDKGLLVEIHLLESRIHHSLSHIPKSKATLTAARTAANSIYCPPALQARLDMQSGTLHAEEGDYKTSYSYFFEAYENNISTAKSNSNWKSGSINCLKYMLLSKIMIGSPEEVNSLISGKLALQYAEDELTAMRSIAESHKNSSLTDFKTAIEEHKIELEEDPIIHRHLNNLYDTLLEKNLLQIIEPFSKIQISHVAFLIQLEQHVVEKKLSQMILDKKLPGILDQGNDCLIIYENEEEDQNFKTVLDTFGSLSEVVDSLYNRAARLF